MSAGIGVRLVLVDRLGSLPRDQRRAGLAKWGAHPEDAAGGASLMFGCPCGCGELGLVAVSTAGQQQLADGRPCWAWNGSRERPTLRPSIQLTVGCRWHGWLTDGLFCGTG